MSLLSQFYSNDSLSNRIPCEFLMIGGGGGGGDGSTSTAGAGGGGGAGQLIIIKARFLEKGKSYNIIIGSGGSSNSNGGTTFFGDLEAEGGGAGGRSKENSIKPQLYSSAGSFGDKNDYYTNKTITGKYTTLTTEGLFSSFAHNSGSPEVEGEDRNLSPVPGGGGAGSPGYLANRAGGDGVLSSITGISTTYGEGGAGGRNNFNLNGASASANTGSGGEGASDSSPTPSTTGGNGGSGVVIIAYADTYPAPSAITGTYNTPSRSGYRVYRFTGSGSITF